MLIPVVLFIVGFVLLIKGGDWFVDGAVGIARRFHVPELLIGATVVSIGTTLPEVMVSASSAIGGHGEIAYGNAIGSIICNTALISALTIAVAKPSIDRKEIKIPIVFFFVSALFYMAVAYTSGFFSRMIGIVLLIIFAAYIIYNVIKVRSLPQPENDEEEQGSLIKHIVFLVVGAVLIAFGADLLVDNGTIIAEKLGVPESVIGLTFVALGTSLPELVTAITSLVKGHGALSLGNIVGANIFNLVLVGGVSITLSPFAIPQNKMLFGHNASLVLELPLMLFVMAFMTLPTLIRGKFSRIQGIILLCIYAGFCVLQFAL